MNPVKVRIGNKTYNVELAITEEQQEKGLSNKESLPEDGGMLFIFEEPQQVSM